MIKLKGKKANNELEEVFSSLLKDDLLKDYGYVQTLLVEMTEKEAVKMVVDILVKNKSDMVTIVVGMFANTSREKVKKHCDMRQYECISHLLGASHRLKDLYIPPYVITQQSQMELVRRLIISVAKDLRAIIILLAWRIAVMQLSKTSKKLEAQKNLHIYVPIASRLGLWNLKTTLEDLSFSKLNPKSFSHIQHKLHEFYQNHIENLNTVKQEIHDLLSKEKIFSTISSRIKTIYSVYQKMEIKKKKWEEISDLFALRVVVPTVADCYRLLGFIHIRWVPEYNRIKDYIAVPKSNGYRSIHTTIKGSNGCRIEIQIRTKEMHRQSEMGVAAHWLYSQKKRSEELHESYDWVKRLVTIQESAKTAGKVHLDIFQTQIFVFIGHHKIIEIPKNSSVIDAAYAHSTISGNHCIGVLINGKKTSIFSKLSNGDIVKFLLDVNNDGPKKSWISHVKTEKAKEKILLWFKQQKQKRKLINKQSHVK